MLLLHVSGKQDADSENVKTGMSPLDVDGLAVTLSAGWVVAEPGDCVVVPSEGVS